MFTTQFIAPFDGKLLPKMTCFNIVNNKFHPISTELPNTSRTICFLTLLYSSRLPSLPQVASSDHL